MTYLRSVLFESESIGCHLATLDAAEPSWSAPYRVQGPRLLLPLTQRFECRLGANAFVCDPAAALWLSPDDHYQLSAFHLARRFRLHTGMSLHGFRNQLRMTLALDRLREGERSISALALELGFASHAHFTVAFRRAFGMAPSQMRTNLEAPRLH